MRATLRAAMFALGLGAAIALAAGDPRAADALTLETLLDRAAWYLDYFIDRFENVVAEEEYIQDAATLLPTYGSFGGGRGGPATQPPSAADAGRGPHRGPRSDFLLVTSPQTRALLPLRDEITVDRRL